MIENIFVGALAVIVAAAGIWAWRLETGGFRKKSNNKKVNEEDKDIEKKHE